MSSPTLQDAENTGTKSSKASVFTIGRKVGILLLFQLAAALMLPFILAKPITAGSPAFLTEGAEHAIQVRLAVFVSFIGSSLTVYLGITMFQVFRLYSKTVAILFLVICAASCLLDLVHAGTILSLMSISKQFISLGAENTEFYNVIATMATLARRSAHAIQLLAISAWICTFYVSLWRFRLIPRVLSAIAITGGILQFTGVTLMMLLGLPLIGEMAMPMLPIQVTVGIWLIAKGFRSHRGYEGTATREG